MPAVAVLIACCWSGLEQSDAVLLLLLVGVAHA